MKGSCFLSLGPLLPQDMDAVSAFAKVDEAYLPAAPSVSAEILICCTFTYQYPAARTRCKVQWCVFEALVQL